MSRVLVIALCTLAATAEVASAASTQPTVTGSTMIGGTLTATPITPGDQIEWETCSTDPSTGSTTYSPPLSDPNANPDTYTPTLADQGSDICAVERLLVGTASSDPDGPIAGLLTPPTLSTTGPVTQGQTIALTQGSWGAGAMIGDFWRSCDSAGCTTVQDGGLSYTATRTDAGDVIEVLEGASDDGQVGGPVTSIATGTVSASPPAEETAPAISGTDVVGDTLTASPGTWTNDPSGYVYQWERCSAGSCDAISGAINPTYSLTGADAGDAIEVLVAALVPGARSETFPSYPTGTVTQPSSGDSGTTSGSSTGTGGTATPRRIALGRVQSLLQWTFRFTPALTKILQLEASEVPVGVHVTVHCSGRGCPFSVRRSQVRASRHCAGHQAQRCSAAARRIDLQVPFRRRSLRVGAQIVVTFTRSREVGKYYRFVVRPRRQPSVRIACLAPGSSRPGHGCTGV